MFRNALTLPIVLLSINSGYAQALRDQAPAMSTPKTKLEAFTGESGAVIIKGYTDVGTVRSLGNITVAATTFRNAKTGDETKGLVISLKAATTYSSEANAYIDYDEIASLLAGIDYVSQADTSITKLANFEATYSTRGNLKVTVFNSSNGTNQVSIKIGTVGPGAFFKLEDLIKLRESIAAAKAILDNPDSVAAKGNRAAPPPVASVPNPPAVPNPAPFVAPNGPPKPKPKPVNSATPLKLN